MTYSTDGLVYLGGGGFEIHCHDQGKLVVISAKLSVACSVIHVNDDCTPTFKQNQNMQGLSHIHTFTKLYICQI